MKTKLFLFWLIFLCGGLASGCGSGDCPPRSVTIDAGLVGLPEIGEPGSKETCLAVCQVPSQTCKREAEMVFTCFPHCE
jgi:hypothetical protein